jgi:hypothetical protein
MKISAPQLRRAFTVWEGLLVGAVLLLLLAMLLPALRSPKHHRHPQINCANNLKQIGIAFGIWAGDNGGKFPMEVPLAAGGAQELIATGKAAAFFQVMSNELGSPAILICPDDDHHVRATNFDLTPANISYFVGLNVSETNSATLLSGDANLSQNGRPVPAGIVNLWKDSATWAPDRHHGEGNVLVADGSVKTVSKIGFASAAGTYFATNQIVIP